MRGAVVEVIARADLAVQLRGRDGEPLDARGPCSTPAASIFTRASLAGRSTDLRTLSMRRMTAASEYWTVGLRSSSIRSPESERHERAKMLPERLRASASSTMAPRSARRRASRGPSFHVLAAWWTTIGRSSGCRISRSSRARAWSGVMPPSATPPTFTPGAISFARAWS